MRKQVKTIKEGEDIIRDKLAGAMATMTELNSSAMGSPTTSSSFAKEAKEKAQIVAEESDLQNMKNTLTIQRQMKEIARLKGERDSLSKFLDVEKEKARDLFEENNELMLKLEISEHNGRKLKVSFERSQNALKLALEECTKLLKNNK